MPVDDEKADNGNGAIRAERRHHPERHAINHSRARCSSTSSDKALARPEVQQFVDFFLNRRRRSWPRKSATSSSATQVYQLVGEHFKARKTGTVFGGGQLAGRGDHRAAPRQRTCTVRESRGRMRGRAVEWVIERALFLCAALSVLTTAGIILVLAVETVGFLREVSVARVPDRHRMDARSFAEQQFGVLPLVAGTVLVSAIAMVVALPMGLLSAIYLSEYARPGLRRVAQADARDSRRRADGRLRVLRADVRDAAAAAASFRRLAGFNALSPGIVMGIMILPLVSSLVGGCDAGGAARAARGRVRAGRDAHADRAPGGRAGRVLGHHRGVHPGGLARHRRDDDRRHRGRPAAPPHAATRSCRSRR